MKKLVLIDGNAIMHRAYHAIPKLTSKGKLPINAVYGLTSMLLRIVSDLCPTHLAVCFDRKEPTFRKKLLSTYQAQRPETDNQLSSQFKPAKEVLFAMNIAIFEKVGFEADDLIGTIAQRGYREFDQVVIVTGDRDMLQLVNDKKNIKLYMPIRGLSEAKMFGEKETFERMGVNPSQIIDYKALVGDPSDNYPGVFGIGPKTAEILLKKYKSMEGVYNKIDELDEKNRTLLNGKKEDADLSYKLAKIVINVPIKINLDELGKWRVYNLQVEQVFSRLGFKSLKERAEKVANKTVSFNQADLF